MHVRKNIWLFILLFFSLLFLSCFSFAEPDVAYFYSRNFKIDKNLLNEFKELNLSVELINEKSSNYNLSKYRILYFGDDFFKKASELPLGNKSSIITNVYHGVEWGLVDSDGINSLGSNNPLKINISGMFFPAYTKGIDKKGIAIPYYYLGNENKAPSMNKVAATSYGREGLDLGDVISYAKEGSVLLNGKTTQGKICFFGIVQTEYWTNKSRELFRDCVAYVLSECRNDSDCHGENLSSYFFCDGRFLYQLINHPFCQNPGQINAKCIYQNDSVLVQECSDYCLNGECRTFTCRNDSDCNDNNQYTRDVCNNPNTINSSCSYEPIRCLSNSDCNDGNSRTFDECVNPGSVSSFCRNTLVNCISNSDCGITGFIGSEFCTGRDVYKQYQQSVCINPSTLNSYCVVNVSSVLINSCNYNCANGICIRCLSNSDCNDGNSSTIDICNNPGTTASSCSYNVVRCFSDSDCGASYFLNGFFCTGRNVSRNLISFKCNNAGTSLSYCSNSTFISSVQVCSDYCLNGECRTFTCRNDSDCNDNNQYTRDVCNNPLTPESYCLNVPLNCTEAKVFVNVTYYANYNPPGARKIADISDRIFVGNQKEPYGNGIALINLTKNGSFIVDPLSNKDVHGLHIQRGVDREGAFMEFTLYGKNEPSSRESIKFNIRMQNALITKSVDPEDEFDFENPHNGICGIKSYNTSLDNPGEDEYEIKTEKFASFCSITGSSIDSVKIYYQPSSIVGCY